MTRSELRAVRERYVATGERPAAIALALGLDPAEVAAVFAPAAPVPKVAKRARKPKAAPAEAPETASAPAETFDPADGGVIRHGASHAVSHGYGYVSISGGSRRIF
jgi:hypothetical protein